MKPEDLKVLQELLGEGFSLREAEDLAAQDPGLPTAAASLRESLGESLQNVPQLPLNFTRRVLDQLPAPSGTRWWKDFWTWQRVSLAATAAAALFGLSYLGHQYFAVAPPPVAVLEPDSASQKLHRVRFSTRQPQAKSVAVAGDFNSWVPLNLNKDSEGNFFAEIFLPEGAYAYSFVLDDQHWVPDEAAERIVEDGFGQKNSLLNI